jgi:hypothetical protein
MLASRSKLASMLMLLLMAVPFCLNRMFMMSRFGSANLDLKDRVSKSASFLTQRLSRFENSTSGVGLFLIEARSRAGVFLQLALQQILDPLMASIARVRVQLLAQPTDQPRSATGKGRLPFTAGNGEQLQQA